MPIPGSTSERGSPCNGYATVSDEVVRVPGTDLPVLARAVERLLANTDQFIRKFIVAVFNIRLWNVLGYNADPILAAHDLQKALHPPFP